MPPRPAVRSFRLRDLPVPAGVGLLAYLLVRRGLRGRDAPRLIPPQTTSDDDATTNDPGTEASRAPDSGVTVRRFHICDALLPVALLVWLLSARRVDPMSMDDWGLLRVLPVSYFVALAVLVLSSAWLLSSKRVHPIRLGLHLVALVLILHGTVPFIFEMPNYPWLYKHVGVVSYIDAHGTVDKTIDIYHNWPGFFALAAWFGRLAGVDSALSYAAWAPVYFSLLVCLQLSFVFRALPISRRTRWLALFCFVPFNWVGQDYFAPQAIAIVLALGVFGMTLTWLRTEPSRLVLFLRRLSGRVRASRAGLPSTTPPAPPTDLRPARLCAIFAVFGFLVVAHQLTPYAVVIGLGLVSAAGFVRPRWVVVTMAAIALMYLRVHLDFLAGKEDLLGSLFNIFDNLNSDGFSSTAEPGRRLTALGAPAMMLGLLLLAGLGILRRLRAKAPVLMMTLLAASVWLIAVASSYGGEAVFRVYLFSLPWTVPLAACVFHTQGRAFFRLRAVAVFGLLLGTSALFMSAFLGSAELYHVRPGEVDASSYFYEHAPPGSVLVLGAPQFPARLSANYASYVSGDLQPNVLEPEAGFRNRVLGPDAVDDLSRFAEAQATQGGSSYFVVTASQKLYAQVLGLSPKGSLARLESAVAASADWRLVCRNTDAALFIRAPGPAAGHVSTCRRAEPAFRPPLPSASDAAGLALALPLLALAFVRRRREAGLGSGLSGRRERRQKMHDSGNGHRSTVTDGAIPLELLREAEEPVGVAEEPVGVAEEPVGVAEETVRTAQEPVGVAEPPVRREETQIAGRWARRRKAVADRRSRQRTTKARHGATTEVTREVTPEVTPVVAPGWPSSAETLTSAFSVPAEDREPLRIAFSRREPEWARLTELLAGVEHRSHPEAIRLLRDAWGPVSSAYIRPLLSDPLGAMRTAAVEALDVTQEDVPQLLHLLVDDLSAPVRVASLAALMHASEADQLSALTRALADPQPTVRAAAIVSLPVAGTVKAAQCLVAAADDAHEDVRHAAARRLATAPDWLLWMALRSSSHFDELGAVIEQEAPGRLAAEAGSRSSSPEPGDRLVAVELAGKARTPESLSLLIDALRDSDARVRRAAVAPLSGCIDAVAPLGSVLRDPDRSVRLSAVQALAGVDHDDAVDALITAASDPDNGVREEAIDALVLRRSPGLARRLAARLTGTNEAGVGEALLRMGSVGEEALAATIEEQTGERGVAAASLLRDRQNMPGLLDGLDSVDTYARLRAVEELGRVGGPDAVDRLIVALSDPWGPIRSRAMYYLNGIGDERCLEAMREAAATEHDHPEVVGAARKTPVDFE